MRPASSPAKVANAFTPAYRTQPRHSCLIDLFSQSDPEPHYAVTTLIPAGITVLGSKSLTHLTTLAVSLSISISLGESALDRLPASRTGVLYLTTNPAATQRHFRDLDSTNNHAAHSSLSNITLIDIYNTDPAQLIADLESTLNLYPSARFIVIDTLFALCQNRRSLINNYHLLARLRTLCEERHLSILLPHRIPRTRIDDVPDAFSSLPTFTNDPDVHFLLLHQLSDRDGFATFTLRTSGYLLDEQTFPLIFNRCTNRWSIGAHDSLTYPLSQQRQRILDLLYLNRAPLSVSEIAARLDIPINPIKQLIHSMKQDGQLYHTGDHRYYPTAAKSTATENPLPDQSIKSDTSNSTPPDNHNANSSNSTPPNNHFTSNSLISTSPNNHNADPYRSLPYNTRM